MNPEATDVLQNLQKNGLTMNDQDFSASLSKLGGMVSPENKEGFDKWSDSLSAHRTLMQTQSSLTNNLGTLSDQDFISNLGKASQAAIKLGEDPSDVRAEAGQIYQKRINLPNQSSGWLQGAARAMASPFQEFGATVGGAVAAAGGELATGVGQKAQDFGSFLSQWFPNVGKTVGKTISNVGKTVENAGQFAESQTEGAMEHGINAGYLGNVTPWGSAAATLEKAGVIGHDEAVARGAVEALGGSAQIAAMLNPEMGLIGTAGVLGGAEAAKGIGQGEQTGQALTEGAQTAAVAAVFGLAAGVAVNATGGIINKALRTTVGKQLVNAGDALLKKAQNLVPMLNGEDSAVAESELDGVTDNLKTVKMGLFATLTGNIKKVATDFWDSLQADVHQGSTKAYTVRETAFNKVYNKGINLSGDDFSNTATELESQGGKLGIRNGQDLSASLEKAKTDIQKEISGSMNRGSARGVSTFSLPADQLESEAAQRAGLSPEDITDIKRQAKMSVNEEPTARPSFTRWYKQVQDIIKDPQGTDTGVLQSYLNPPSFGGKYDSAATKISNAIREDLEGKFQEEGLTEAYKAATVAQKQIPEDVTTKLRQVAFDASSQDVFVNKIVSGEVKPTPMQINGMAEMLEPETREALQNSLINEVKRQVDEAVSGASKSGDPESGYKEGKTIIDNFINNYANTPFLRNPDRTNLAQLSSFLNRDLSKDFTSPIATGEMAEGLETPTTKNPEVSVGQEALQAGKNVAATKNILSALKEGPDPVSVAKTYDGLSTSEKGTFWNSLETPEAKSNMANTILQGKTQKIVDDIKGVSNGTREELDAELKNLTGKFTAIRDDASLFKNMTPEQQMTINETIQAEEGLATLQGNKYREAAIKIAKAPVISALGHPLGSLSNLIGGIDRVIESVFSNTEKITPTQMKLYDDIMESAGKDSGIYKTFSNIRSILENPNLKKTVRGAVTAVGGITNSK